MAEPRLSKSELIELLAEHRTAKAVAPIAGISERQVQRLMQQNDIERSRQNAPRITAAEWDRIDMLTREGMPTTLIAEDLGRNLGGIREAVIKRFAGTDVIERRNSEWKNVWPTIVKNPALYALHQEFSPRKKVHA